MPINTGMPRNERCMFMKEQISNDVGTELGVDHGGTGRWSLRYLEVDTELSPAPFFLERHPSCIRAMMPC